MGKFSSDRAVMQYADVRLSLFVRSFVLADPLSGSQEIWNVEPLKIPKKVFAE